eukprot:634380-Prymnesium_polylepis.1
MQLTVRASPPRRKYVPGERTVATLGTVTKPLGPGTSGGRGGAAGGSGGLGGAGDAVQPGIFTPAAAHVVTHIL